MVSMLSKNLIEHCKKIVPRENFKFEHFDLYHHLYNKNGLIDVDTFDFPYPGNFFDVTFAASVFSHLNLNSAASYLKEINRVLNPGGVAILSMFAIPEAETQLVGGVTSLLGAGEGEYSYRFKNAGEGFYTHCDLAGRPKNHYMPDDVGDPVAYERRTFQGLCEKAGLKTIEFLWGAWRFTGYKYGWQDMFILQK